MNGEKPLRNRKIKDLLSENEYRQYIEVYGEKGSSIFSAVSSQGSVGEDKTSQANKERDVDMGFSNNGLR